MRKALFVLASAFLCASVTSVALGQTAGLTSGTTITSDINDRQTTIPVASVTNITGPGLNQNNGITIGSTTGGPNYNILYLEGEAVRVNGVSGLNVTVQRGVNSTFATAHKSGANVYVGAANLPRFRTSGAGGVGGGQFWLPPGACSSTVSGNSSGTNGLTVAGASNTPVVQASTSSTGTNTHTFLCNLTVPTNQLTNIVWLTDAEFFYGVQTTAIGTQVATLASGTMNSAIVFSKIAYPLPGASETASTVTPVRADSGTLTITPAVGSFNTATTTAGGFYSVKFTPQWPIAMNADSRQLLLTVALLNTATSATVTNSPGVLIHFTVGNPPGL